MKEMTMQGIHFPLYKGCFSTIVIHSCINSEWSATDPKRTLADKWQTK